MANKKILKLPRKRKKAYIVALNRNNYHGLRKSFLPMEGLKKFPKDIVSRFTANGVPEFKTLSYW